MNGSGRRPRALVVHESMFGNTAEIARSVAQGLREGGVECTTEDVGSADPTSVGPFDLVVAGAPTHAFTLSTERSRADAVRQGAPSSRAATGLREWLLRASPPQDPPVLLATFDTRVRKVRHLPQAAASKAARVGAHRGFRVCAPPAAFLVDDVKGPASRGETARAVEWGRALAGRVLDPQGAAHTLRLRRFS